MLSTPTFSGFTIPETAGGVWRYCAVYSFHSTDVSFRLHAALGGPSLFPVRDSRLRLSTLLVYLSTSFLIHVCDISVRVIHCRKKGGMRGSTCGESPLPILCMAQEASCIPSSQFPRPRVAPLPESQSLLILSFARSFMAAADTRPASSSLRWELRKGRVAGRFRRWLDMSRV